MNLETISMPIAEATARLEEYREGLRGKTTTDEDRGVILGLQAIAKGKSLIDLHGVFRACPPKPNGLPAFAVARAHWSHVSVEFSDGGAARFYQGRERIYSGRRVAWHTRIMLPGGTMPREFRRLRELTAVVPLIPPNLRPAKAMHRYCILWEAEWEKVPVDPMLIRHLYGSLYVVLACWDLTPLERAVLAGRLTERQ